MNLSSKIYIDGGDPQETREADAMLKKAGYHGLDGQTTNPTLIAKKLATSDPARREQETRKLTEKEAIEGYRKTVEEMSKIIPEGKISIQVIGDPATLTTEDMITQARDRITWIPNGVIKFPCTMAGLAAVEVFCQEGPVNITLNFSQEQAAAVYAATKAHNYDVFLSPFVGRLDDKGENGMDVVANELTMFRGVPENHVQVLSASVRNMKHLLYALFLKSPVITLPFKVLSEWLVGPSTGSGQNPVIRLPDSDFVYDVPGLADISYKELTLDKDWKEYDLSHPLTDSGVARFWEDWKAIVG